MEIYQTKKHQAFFHYFLNKYNLAKNTSLYNNAFYLIANNIMTSLLGFVFWNVMTRFYTPSNVGIGSSLVAASGLLSALSNMGLGQGLVRFIPGVIDKAWKLINTVFTVASAAAIITCLIYLGGIHYWSPALTFIQGNFLLMVLFALFTITNELSSLTDLSLIAGRAARYVFFKNLFIGLIKIPLPIFVFSSMNGFGIFAGTGTGVLIGLLLSWLLFLPKVYKGFYLRPFISKKVVWNILPFSFGNYTGNILNMAPQFVYPLMVLNTLGPEKSAYFWIAWMMSMVLAIIPSGLAQSLFAEGSYNPNELGSKGLRAFLISFSLLMPAIVLMLLFGGWLLHFFGAEYSEHGVSVMRFLVLAVIPQSVNIFFLSVNQVRKRINLIITQTATLALLTMGVGYWLIGKMGLPGVGLAYFLGHLIVALIVIWPLWKAFKG